MYDPANLIGKPLLDAMHEIEQLAPEDIFSQGGVELHSPSAQIIDAVTSRPFDMMVTTIPDEQLQAFDADHPNVNIPDVTLDQLLGGGGQGWVYAGKVRSTGKIVAVKVLRSDYVAAKGWAAREALICTRISHPNVLRVFEAQQAGQFWVVLMEMVPGTTLGEESLTQPELCRCLVSLADALRALAKNDIVHCDVKPGNVLLRRQNKTPVLVDFGVAHDLNEAEEPETLFGTPFFLAPEAFRKPRPHFAWDAYALGITAAAVLGYQRHYGSMTTLRSDKLSGEFDQAVVAAMQRMKDPGLREWIVSLLNKDPETRLAALNDSAGRLANSL